MNAPRCSICNAERIIMEDGRPGACGFLECPDPMADYKREHPDLFPKSTLGILDEALQVEADLAKEGTADVSVNVTVLKF